MAQHKWHKEIKAWADGAEIEMRTTLSNGFQTDWSNEWTWTDNDNVEYRIKPQPKEPQYLYVYGSANSTMTNIRVEPIENHKYFLGKVKLEVDD